MNIALALVASGILLAANGFFVAAEISLLSARRSRVEQLAAEGNPRAKHALAGLRELSLMLAGAQLGITMCSLGLGIIAEPAIGGLLRAAFGSVQVPSHLSEVLAFGLALGFVVLVHMVVGEMAPKSWALSHPESTALVLARPFRYFARLLRPLIYVLNASANTVVRAMGVEPQDEVALAHSSSDLIMLLDEAVGEGAIELEEHTLLSRSLEVSGLTAEAVMTPRPAIVAVEATRTIPELERESVRTGRSRIVVYNGDLDHPLGVVHVRDVLTHEGTRQTTAGELAGPVLLTPNWLSIEELFLRMRLERRHLALAVDEHGIVIGLITMEDVLEELIGDFEDESDRASRRIRWARDGSAVAPGSLRPEEVENRLGCRIPKGDWDTLAGFLIAQLGRVPYEGDVVKTPTATFEVAVMDGVAVREVRITRLVN